MSVAPRVSVVIPTWNGRALLELVMPSLERQRTATSRRIVVDNGSSDGTAAHVRERWPWVESSRCPTTSASPPASTAASSGAGGEYVALVNNDMELDPDFLGELVAALDDAARGGVGHREDARLRRPRR